MSERCKEGVYPKGTAFLRFRQCARKAVKDGYCAQHHPDAVVKKREAQDARWKAKQDRQRANARLHMAAPMMLEACEAALEAFDGAPIHFSRENAKAIQLLRDAIAKATGHG